MTYARARDAAIEAVTSWPNHGRRAPKSTVPIRQLFGSNVFSDDVMRARLPENIYKAIRKTIKKGAPLDPSIADVVAADDEGVGAWSEERPTTHTGSSR